VGVRRFADGRRYESEQADGNRCSAREATLSVASGSRELRAPARVDCRNAGRMQRPGVRSESAGGSPLQPSDGPPETCSYSRKAEASKGQRTVCQSGRLPSLAWSAQVSFDGRPIIRWCQSGPAGSLREAASLALFGGERRSSTLVGGKGSALTKARPRPDVPPKAHGQPGARQSHHSTPRMLVRALPSAAVFRSADGCGRLYDTGTAGLRPHLSARGKLFDVYG